MRSGADLRHLLVGHVCWDELADGRVVLGGTVYYSAQQAASLGCRVTVETSCTPQTLGTVRAVLGPGVLVRAAPSDADTRYAFEPEAENGPTRLVSLAGLLTFIDSSGMYDSAHIAPIAGEVTSELVHVLRDRVGFLGITAQGLMREFSAGRLRGDAARKVPVLAVADAVVVNEAEYLLLLGTQPEVVRECPAPFFVTRGSRGASLFQSGDETARCAAPQVELHPHARVIGAGDVFASTVFVGLARGARPAGVLVEAVHAASAFVSRPREMHVTGN